MAENSLPTPVSRLFPKTRRMGEGLYSLEHEGKTGKALHQGLLTKLNAAESAEHAFQGGRAERDSLLLPAKMEALAAVLQFIKKTRKQLQFFLGEQWSPSWAEAGFVRPSLALPPREAEREALIKQLAAYLAKHPEMSNDNQGVTSENLLSLHQALIEANAALDSHASAQALRRKDRDAKVKALRVRARGVMHELKEKVGGSDECWRILGLNAPDSRATPKAPRKLKVERKAGESGGSDVLVAWQPAVRASSYRVFRKVEGVDEEFVAMDDVATTNLVLHNQPVDKVVSIRVKGLNEAGEGPAAESQALLAA